MLGLLLILTGCTHREPIAKKLAPSLACKGFTLYYPESKSHIPYQETLPDDLAEWEEVTALLSYDETLERCKYDKDADNTEDAKEEEQTTVHITHFLTTAIPFPRLQRIRIRYYKYAPLMFEWISLLKVCPRL